MVTVHISKASSVLSIVLSTLHVLFSHLLLSVSRDGIVLHLRDEDTED